MTHDNAQHYHERAAELRRRKQDPMRPDPHPDEEIQLIFDQIDAPIEDRDTIEKAEEKEAEVMRAERDQDNEVVDDIPDQEWEPGFSFDLDFK